MALITIAAPDRETLIEKLEATLSLVKEGFDEHHEDSDNSLVVMKVGDDLLDEDDN